MTGEHRSLMRVAAGLRDQARQLLNQAAAIEALVDPAPKQSAKKTMTLVDPINGRTIVVKSARAK